MRRVKKENAAPNIRYKISNLFELPKEIVMNLPLITIVGNQEINIENYKGVVEYTEEKIRVNTSCGIFKIEGRKLSLKQVTSEVITVSGAVTKLEYIL